jgi:hypothetical protein
VGNAKAFLAVDADGWLGGRQSLADFDCRNSGGVQCFDQRFAGVRGDCDQQASGGLGIEEDGSNFVGNSGLVFDQTFGEVAIGFEASGDVAGPDAVEGAVENGDAAGVKTQRDIRGES